MPPAFLALIGRSESSNYLIATASQFIDAHDGWLLALVVLPAVILILISGWEVFASYLQTRSYEIYPEQQHQVILAMLRVILGKKMDRFGNACRRIYSYSGGSWS